MNNFMIEGHETVLLAALMNGAADLPVDSDDFSSPPNKTIFQTIQSLNGNRNLLAVTHALRKNGQLEKVGGEYRITQISLLPHDKDNVEYALGEVLDYSRERHALETAKALINGRITLEKAQEWFAQLNEQRFGLPPIEDGAERISKAIDLPEDVIKGVLHRGAKMVLGGTSKSFKTWTLLELSVSVATGTSWLGQFETNRGRVLYINLELPAPWLFKRLQTICDECQVTLAEDDLRVWNLRGHAADITQLAPSLLRGIGRARYALIVLDPIYKLLGARDENKAGDIAVLLNEIEKIAVKTGAAIVFGAHYSKGNQAAKEAIDRIGGSGVFARDPDSMLNFTRHEENDCFTVDATLRNHAPIQPFVVRWKFPLMCAELCLNPEKLKRPGAPKIYREEKLLELIDQPLSATEIVKLAYDEMDFPRRRVFEMLDKLVSDGKLKKHPGKRGKYEQA
jgi:hypothetical protein